MTKLLVIDTETGGTEPTQHSLLSLAAVVWVDGVSTAEFQVLVGEDPLVVTSRAMEINRIDLGAHGKTALPPVAALAALRSFLTSHCGDELSKGERLVLAGQNVSFDIGFLKRLCGIAGEPFDGLFSHRSLDTASILSFLGLAGLLPPNVVGSTEAFAYFGIEVPTHERHTALGDARATALLLSRLVELAGGAGHDLNQAAA